MKKLLFILIIFLNSNLFAHPPAGGGRRQQGNGSQNEQPKKVKKFSSKDAAGIFYYDIEEVIKKLKIKDDKEQYQIKKALKNYNFKIKEISFLNATKFSDFDLAVNSMSKSNNVEDRREMRKKVEVVLRPIREKVRENEMELNSVFKTFLSEKNLKKWYKYQKKKKESLQPQKPENRGNNNSRQRGGERGSRRQ